MFDEILMMAQPGEGGGGGGMSLLIMFALIFVVMYFFMIRPQQKREKSRRKMITELKKGDKVVTNSGIIGSIWGIKENIVVLKIDSEVKMEVLKSAIASKMEQGD